MEKFKVWIDQDLCTGDGLCVELCPSLFAMNDDGLAYVKEVDWPNLRGPAGTAPAPVHQGPSGLATVPAQLLDDAIEAAEECPGECIFLTPEG